MRYWNEPAMQPRRLARPESPGSFRSRPLSARQSAEPVPPCLRYSTPSIPSKSES